jgi:hypothetical protein
MKNTTTLERLVQKPLNAKYYPYDLEHVALVDQKKYSFFTELSRYIIQVLDNVYRPTKE